MQVVRINENQYKVQLAVSAPRTAVLAMETTLTLRFKEQGERHTKMGLVICWGVTRSAKSGRAVSCVLLSLEG